MNARRLVVRLAACVVAAIATSVAAQEWPRTTTRIVVPFAPGSTPDVVGRLVADRLAHDLGQPFVVENKPGAGGMLGTATVARAPPDGTTIGVSIGGPLVNNTVLYRSMTYDPFRDLAPVTRLVDQPCVLVASPRLAAAGDDVGAWLAHLPEARDGLNYASLGNGTVSHLVMVLIANRAHAKLVQVPYPGSAQAVAALLAGEVGLGCLPPAAVLPQVRAGALRLFGIAARTRSPLFPDAPTLAERGLPGIEANAWIGVVAPAKTPPAVVARMRDAIAKVLGDPDVVRTFAAQFMQPVGDTPQAFAAFLADELARWGPVIREQRIVLD